MICLCLLSAKEISVLFIHFIFLSSQYKVHGRKTLKQNVRLQYLGVDGRIILK